jgi:hypothetical protein
MQISAFLYYLALLFQLALTLTHNTDYLYEIKFFTPYKHYDYIRIINNPDDYEKDDYQLFPDFDGFFGG